MKLSEELRYRGMVAQHTFDNIAELDEKKHTFYWGTDPSADSLHVGHLATLMMIKVFERHGYQPILLVGGATGMVGDPKSTSERDMIPIETINANKKTLHDQIQSIVGKDIPMVDNYDWFKNFNTLDFIREVGKQFSMTQLLDRDFVKQRIGDGKSGISFAEFSYSLIQGYDYLWLYRNREVTLQVCGADQWGNCVSGMHLIKRLEGARVDVWSMPLVIDKVSGIKFGKSEGNAVWLDASKTSVFDYYQFWINVDDNSAEDYLRLYTAIEPDEIAEIIKLHRKNPSVRGAQKALALAATEVVHGREAAVNAAHITNVLFGDEDVRELSPDGLRLLSETIPVVKKGVSVVEALVSCGVASSNSEAMRLIRGNGVAINGIKIAEDLKIDELSVIKKGKNQFILVK